MQFERRDSVPFAQAAYVARDGAWQFLIVCVNGQWSMSYRLRKPTTEVSASSTLKTYGSFQECAVAAEKKLRELSRLN